MGYASAEDVRKYLPNAIVIQGENPTPNPRNPNPESLTLTDIEYYVEQSDAQINSILGAIYDTPFRKGNIGGEIKYPEPIVFISAVMAAWMIFQQRLSGADRTIGDFTERMYKIGMSRLDDILNGRIRLLDQDSYTAHRTIRSDLFPMPPTPFKNPSDMGKL
jgi:hypothetical protein